MIKILFICHGNICRSTMCQSVMTHLIAQQNLSAEYQIDSAATSRDEIGNSPHYGTVNRLKQAGIPVVPHRAIQMTKADYAKYDYLIGMDTANIRNMTRIAGGDPSEKIHKLLTFAGSGRDIADPWYTGNFDETYEDVLEGCTAFLDHLQKHTDRHFTSAAGFAYTVSGGMWNMKNENYGSIRECEDIPLSFPPQHQNCQPGLEYMMEPKPVSKRPACEKRLARKVAVITGGDSGIGRAVAYEYVREGAAVALVYYNEERDAKETEEQIRRMGGSCLLLQGDLKDRYFAKECIRDTIACFGKLDILVNNHAVQFIRNSILDIPPKQLELVFQTNIISFFYTIQSALPHMKNGSSIINTASVTAYEGNKDLIDYSATKGAIVALTRSLALSLAEQGIRVNAVAPGPIWTPLIPASYSAEEVATFGRKTSQVPMMRAGQPCEVSPAYVFLASEDASYMTGQVLHPNGGTIVGS